MDDLHELLATRLESVLGWCSVEKADYLAERVNEDRVRNFLELGVYGGRSLIAVALAVKTVFGSDLKDVSVVGVDPWSAAASLENNPMSDEASLKNAAYWSRINYEAVYNGCKDSLKQFGVSSIVRLERTTAKEYVDKVPSRSLDMLHQDGNHEEMSCCREVDLYYDKVRPGGLWIFDDTNWKSTQNAQRKLEEYGYNCIHDAYRWKAYRRSKDA